MMCALVQEELCSSFFDCAGTPRLGGKSAWEPVAKSSSGTNAMTPDADETEETAEAPTKAKPVKAEEGEFLGLSSPDPQAPTRRVTWGGQESFNWAEEEPPHFLPDDACAEDDDGIESTVSTELDRSDVGTVEVVDKAIIRDDCDQDFKAADDGQCLTLDNCSDAVQVCTSIGYVGGFQYSYLLCTWGLLL